MVRSYPPGEPVADRGMYLADTGRLLDDLAGGASRLVSVEGGPGSGKSTMLLELDRAVAARPDLLVLRARCSPDEYDFHLGAVRQLLSGVVGRSELDGRLALARTGTGDPLGHEALHHLFGTLADVVTQRTLVLLVDDAHWADEPSARFLAHLARRMHQLTVLLVLAHDPHEPSPNAAALAQLAGDPAAVTWRLGPLDRAAVAAACRLRLGTDDPATVDLCGELTHGVPFLVTELLAQAERVRDRGDESLRSVLLGCAPMNVATITLNRARRHGTHLPAVLGALSVLRSPVGLAQAAGVTGLTLERLEDALAVLRRLSLVTVVAEPGLTGQAAVAVTPELVRRSVSQALHPSERHSAEARAAGALAGDDRTRDAAALHLVETYPAGEPAHVEILRRAAADAVARGSVELAAAFLRRALAEPPPPEAVALVHAELGAVELCYDADSAVTHLRSAYDGTAGPAARAERALRLAYGLMLVDRAAAAASVLTAELAADALPAGDPLLVRMRSELVLARLGDDGVLEPVNTASTADTVDSGDRAGRQALAVRALLGAFACRPMADVVRDAQAALSGAVTPGEDGSIAQLTASAVLIWSDDLTGADRFLAQFARECTRRGEVLCATIAGGLRGLVAIRVGDLTTAASHLAVAASLAPRRPDRSDHGLAPLALALEFAVESENPDAVLDQLLRANLAGDLPRRWLGAVALGGRGRVRVLAGDVGRGLADLTEAGRRLERIGCHNPAIVPWRSAAAQALTLLGRPEEARVLADTEVDLARTWGAPRTLAVALRQRGSLRRGVEGLSDLDEAVDLLGPDGFPLERARTLLARGRVHRAHRQPGVARAALTDAYDLAILSGADRLAERIQDELLASGGRPRVRSRLDRSVLTGGEERVARMAVDGLTNEEIARRLYLARRTVESHLTSTYRKLNIRGRSQLAAALRPEPAHSEQPDRHLAG